MDFIGLQESVGRDEDYPERQFRLNMLTRVLRGTLYDHLEYAFEDETNGAEEYVPLRERRPSVRSGTALMSLVVDDSVSMLFSEGHFPEIECDNEEKRDQLNAIIGECNLNEQMIEGATVGSVGSVVFWLRILEGRAYIEVMPTEFLTPEFNPERPDELVRVTEQYKVKGDVLADMGYSIPKDDLNQMHWWRRDWDATSEIHYLPWPVARDQDENCQPETDKERSIDHHLGFVPMVWVKNLPGGDKIDGACTFEKAIDTAIEIDYQLSQIGRGLRYSSDPTLLIKEPAIGEGAIVKGASNAIVVGSDGDAKMLEIGGTAAEAVINYVRTLREFALESIHGNRSNADKISAAQSGRAMELMNQALIWLADRLRITYGEGAYLRLLNMIVDASKVFPLEIDGQAIDELSDDPISLRWPQWYPPTPMERQTNASTLKELRDAGLMSTKTALKVLAAEYDIEDVEAELKEIEADQASRPAPTKVQETISVDE